MITVRSRPLVGMIAVWSCVIRGHDRYFRPRMAAIEPDSRPPQGANGDLASEAEGASAS
jgi:hypothetical protein